MKLVVSSAFAASGVVRPTLLRVRLFASAAVLAAITAVGVAGAQMAPTSAPAKKSFQFIDPATVRPDQILPPPPDRGSAAEALELAQLRQLIAQTTPERLAQARSDDEHEDPAIFDATTGLKLEMLPVTWALLRTVQNDANLTANLAKVQFKRTRPWGVDPALPNCDAGKGKSPLGSYPSGHSVMGYSVGYTLAQLMPDRATAILSRAQDYALSREICGVHFRSDTAASQVIGTLVAARLLADPRLAARIAAARAELTKH